MDFFLSKKSLKAKLGKIRSSTSAITAPVKLTYWTGERNLGDALNHIIISKLFGLNIEHTNQYNAEMVSIGSWLQTLYSEKGYKALNSQANNKTSFINVWGTGFMHDVDLNDFYIFKNFRVYALRGRLSLEKLIKSGLCVGGGMLKSH